MRRNFWGSMVIDGRKHSVAGGPKAKDGGMDFTLTQKTESGIKEVLRVQCTAAEDGSLLTEVFNEELVCIYRYMSRR